MSSQRYPEEFRIEAAKQILEHGHSVVRLRTARMYASCVRGWSLRIRMSSSMR